MRMKNRTLENVRLFHIVSLVIFTSTLMLILPAAAYAYSGINFYKIDVDVDENNLASVGMVITFKEPEKRFSFDIIGRIEGLEATSNAGPVDCVIDVSGISSIKCDMNLTEVHKEVVIKFKTNDFVRSLDNKLYLSADLTPRRDVDGIYATFKLPQGSFLVEENITSSIFSYPENATAHLAGGRILIIWDLSGIKSDEQLKFEMLYEQIKTPPWFQLRMRHFILFGSAFAVVLGFIVIRYFRKSEKLILSVLDEYERQIMNIITNEGEIKQRKIVKLTNLSKAKVSRVIKSLAERGLIEVERMGRTNRIRLLKKKLKL